MKKLVFTAFSAFLLLSCTNTSTPSSETPNISTNAVGGPTIVIHGGAGSIVRKNMSDADIAAYEASLQNAVDQGYNWLSEGLPAEEVVVRVIELMESDSLFNSGVGAVVNANGIAELDASIMRGNDLNAGAISGVHHIEHPIRLAKLVMDSSEHVMLSGEGAEIFAYSMGLDSVDNQMFVTNRRMKQYRKVIEDKMGTVGVVVLDANGDLAAGTSTGGMMMKKYGRVGDSPIIGAGTYADNEGCAVSCTGHGEFFIRHAIAHQLSIRTKNGENLYEVAQELMFETLSRQHGPGGIIALRRSGEYNLTFNTTGMFRGVRNSDTTYVAMFEE